MLQFVEESLGRRRNSSSSPRLKFEQELLCGPRTPKLIDPNGFSLLIFFYICVIYLNHYITLNLLFVSDNWTKQSDNTVGPSNQRWKFSEVCLNVEGSF